MVCLLECVLRLQSQVTMCVQGLNAARQNVFPGVSLTAANCPATCAGILKVGCPLRFCAGASLFTFVHLCSPE